MHTQYWKSIATVLGVSAGALMIAAFSAAPAYAAFTDDNPAGVSQCTNAAVNDAGTEVGTCENGNARQAFVRELAARSSTILAPLAVTLGGVPCAATGISNAAAGNEIIVGWCADANNVPQGVFWNSGTPTTAPTLLKPNSTAGLLPDVETSATGFDTAGVIVGVSSNNTGTETPVEWSSTGAPTALLPALLPLLSANANCTPADINDAATPSIIGNCDNAGTGGGNKAVLWASETSLYTVLPVPTNATYCAASEINLSGYILGDCEYGTDTNRVVLWGPGGTGPSVLATVAGATAYRTTASDFNDSGVVACNYLATSAASAGFNQPCVWNTAGGNTNAIAITAPGGATGPAITTAIGNNGIIIGNYETGTGVMHGFYVPSGGSAGVDEGSPEGGPNTINTSESKTGTYMGVVSEDATDHSHDLSGPTP